MGFIKGEGGISDSNSASVYESILKDGDSGGKVVDLKDFSEDTIKVINALKNKIEECKKSNVPDDCFKSISISNILENVKGGKTDDVVKSVDWEVDQKLKEIRDKKHEALMDSIRKADIGDFFTSIINKYNLFLDNLSLDQIGNIFNLIVGGMLLTSYISIFSVLLSENIINRITILEKYPRILYLLKLRNNVNKKVNKLILITHLIIILFGIIGNLFMFFTKYYYG